MPTSAASIVPDRCNDLRHLLRRVSVVHRLRRLSLSQARSLMGTGHFVVASLSPVWMAFAGPYLHAV